MTSACTATVCLIYYIITGIHIPHSAHWLKSSWLLCFLAVKLLLMKLNTSRRCFTIKVFQEREGLCPPHLISRLLIWNRRRKCWVFIKSKQQQYVKWEQNRKQGDVFRRIKALLTTQEFTVQNYCTLVHTSSNMYTVHTRSFSNSQALHLFNAGPHRIKSVAF